jgi:microcystin-dependent protein
MSVARWNNFAYYVVGDIVVGSDGAEYECILANTNTPPPNATYWTDTTPPPIGTFITGMIIMWFAKLPPLGWAICNGNNGTPDLRDRFPYFGTVGNPNIGVQGGSSTVTIDTTNLPVHNHTLTNGTANVVSTDAGHNHTIAGYKLVGTNNGTGDGSEPVNFNNTGNSFANITSVVSGSTDNTGSGTPLTLPNPPYTVVYFIMKL